MGKKNRPNSKAQSIINNKKTQIKLKIVVKNPINKLLAKQSQSKESY